MSKMFIPKEGEMQFEVNRGPALKPCEPFSLRVGQPIKIIDSLLPKCRHLNGYPVIDFCDVEHPMRKYSQIAKGRRNHKTVIVCPCMGRIIE
jgi:hypothetical protein